MSMKFSSTKAQPKKRYTSVVAKSSLLKNCCNMTGSPKSKTRSLSKSQTKKQLKGRANPQTSTRTAQSNCIAQISDTTTTNTVTSSAFSTSAQTFHEYSLGLFRQTPQTRVPVLKKQPKMTIEDSDDGFFNSLYNAWDYVHSTNDWETSTSANAIYDHKVFDTSSTLAFNFGFSADDDLIIADPVNIERFIPEDKSTNQAAYVTKSFTQPFQTCMAPRHMFSSSGVGNLPSVSPEALRKSANTDALIVPPFSRLTISPITTTTMPIHGTDMSKAFTRTNTLCHATNTPFKTNYYTADEIHDFPSTPFVQTNNSMSSTSISLDTDEEDDDDNEKEENIQQTIVPSQAHSVVQSPPESTYSPLSDSSDDSVPSIKAEEEGQPYFPANLHEIEQDQPYAQLIYKALMSAPGHRMILAEIYTYFQKNFPKFKNASGRGWMNSIRHNLSMNGAFLKEDRVDGEKGKGYVWALAPGAILEGVKSTTRYRKNGPASTRKRACPDDSYHDYAPFQKTRRRTRQSCPSPQSISPVPRQLTLPSTVDIPCDTSFGSENSLYSADTSNAASPVDGTYPMTPVEQMWLSMKPNERKLREVHFGHMHNPYVQQPYEIQHAHRYAQPSYDIIYDGDDDERGGNFGGIIKQEW